jgi:hypothetical protein
MASFRRSAMHMNHMLLAAGLLGSVPAYAQAPAVGGTPLATATTAGTVPSLGGPGGAAQLGSDGSITVRLSLASPAAASGAANIVQTTSRTAQSIYSGLVPPTYFTFDGYRSSVVAPLGSTATNTDGFGFYVSNQAVSNGQGGNAVGLFGAITCEVDGCSSWGLNPTLIDNSVNGGAVGSGTGRKLIGAEFDVTATQTGTIIQGISLNGSSTVNPAGADGFSCGSLGGPAIWTHCFVVPDGVAATGLYLGSVQAGGTANSPSAPILLTSYDSGGASKQIRLQASGGVLNVSSPSLANYFALMPAGTGTTPTISAQGTDTNVNLGLTAKGTGTLNVNSPMIASSYAAISGFLNVGGFLVLQNNTTAVPGLQLGTAFSVNQSGGGAETDFWNSFATASTSFKFNQVTGSGAFSNLFSLSATVNASAEPLKLASYTVSALPTCNATYQDALASVSDATAPSYRGALTGGGAVRTPVYCDGTNWTAH